MHERTNGTPMSIHIRPVDPAVDLELYKRGERLSFRQSFPDFAITAEVEARLTRRVHEYLRSAHAWAFTAAGDGPTGYVLLSRRVFYEWPVGHIDSLYVHPDRRRKGVAMALVRHAEAFFKGKGVNILQLEVTANNAVARSLYDRIDFVTTRLSMEKRLNT